MEGGSHKKPAEVKASRVERGGIASRLLHRLGFESGGVLALFFVRVNAEIDLDAFTFGCGFDEAANGRGGEALPANQGSDVGLAEDEAEVHLVLSRVSDAEFGELGILDELKGDVLDEVLDLSGDLFHGERFCRSVEAGTGNEQEFFPCVVGIESFRCSDFGRWGRAW